MDQKAPARVRKSLIGNPEKSVLTRSSNTATTTVDTSRYDVYFTRPATYNLWQISLSSRHHYKNKHSSSGCPKYITIRVPQFNASITHLVIFNQPLKEIQNELVITLISLCDNVCLFVTDVAIIFVSIHKTPHNHMV